MSRQIGWWGRLLAAVMVVSAVTATPALAGDGCFVQLAECFREAAYFDLWWQRTFEALDCELNFIICVRVSVLGL